MSQIKPPRLPIFVPGHRIDIAQKAALSGADMVIIDLEDAVAEPDKASARANLFKLAPLPLPIAVRINSSETPYFFSDIEAIKSCQVDMIVLPKAESSGDLQIICDALGKDMPILPIIETARGLDNIDSLLEYPAVSLCAFGHLDFSLDIGASPAWENLLLARSKLVLQSRLAGVFPPNHFN